MTRKDYELTARILRAEIDTINTSPKPPCEEYALRFGTIAVTADRFAKAYAADNVRFDRARFLRACGLEN
jgi:hypothetical protein